MGQKHRQEHRQEEGGRERAPMTHFAGNVRNRLIQSTDDSIIEIHRETPRLNGAWWSRPRNLRARLGSTLSLTASTCLPLPFLFIFIYIYINCFGQPIQTTTLSVINSIFNLAIPSQGQSLRFHSFTNFGLIKRPPPPIINQLINPLLIHSNHNHFKYIYIYCWQI